MLQMRYGDSYALNKNVFSLFVNVSGDMSGVRRSAVRLLSCAGVVALSLISCSETAA